MAFVATVFADAGLVVFSLDCLAFVAADLPAAFVVAAFLAVALALETAVFLVIAKATFRLFALPGVGEVVQLQVDPTSAHA